jgi:hypothetical protein
MKMDIWTIIWMITCIDLIVKLITISVKVLVTIVPSSLIPLYDRVISKLFLF